MEVNQKKNLRNPLTTCPFKLLEIQVIFLFPHFELFSTVFVGSCRKTEAHVELKLMGRRFHIHPSPMDVSKAKKMPSGEHGIGTNLALSAQIAVTSRLSVSGCSGKEKYYNEKCINCSDRVDNRKLNRGYFWPDNHPSYPAVTKNLIVDNFHFLLGPSPW